MILLDSIIVNYVSHRPDPSGASIGSHGMIVACFTTLDKVEMKISCKRVYVPSKNDVYSLNINDTVPCTMYMMYMYMIPTNNQT